MISSISSSSLSALTVARRPMLLQLLSLMNRLWQGTRLISARAGRRAEGGPEVSARSPKDSEASPASTTGLSRYCQFQPRAYFLIQSRAVLPFPARPLPDSIMLFQYHRRLQVAMLSLLATLSTLSPAVSRLVQPACSPFLPANCADEGLQASFLGFEALVELSFSGADRIAKLDCLTMATGPCR